MARIPLAQVRIAEPCTVPWNSMAGDDKSRHCSFCNLSVHNLSAMTEDAAQRLICETGGRLCVAYYPNADGSPQTLEYRQQKPPRWTWRFTAMLGGVGAAIAGCVAHFTGQEPPTPVNVGFTPGRMMVAGGIGPPLPPPLPPTTQPMLMGDVAFDPAAPLVDGSAAEDALPLCPP